MSAGLLAAACVCSLAAAEVISIKEPEDLLTPKRVVKGDGAISVKGSSCVLLSSKTLTPDPAKKYKVTGEFRLKDGAEGANVYLGFAPFDAEGNAIQASYVNAKAGSDTVVTKAAPTGSSVIYVQDASKWDLKTPFGFIAFNTKADYSDLPNGDLARTVPDGIKQNGDLWEITLKQPLTKDIAEGTAVRQQMAGASYIYSAYKGQLPNEWTTITGTTAGSNSLYGNAGKQFWHGTASARLMISVMNGKANTVVEMKNIVVEEVE